jgi:cell wall-associated NlpC family hydrolase
MKPRALAIAALLVLPSSASAQGFFGQVGRFYDDGGWNLYRLGMNRPLMGPLELVYHGDYMTRAGDGEGAFAGLGLDVTAFRTGIQGPYGVVGLGGGLGSPHSTSFSSFWSSWSLGAGYELAPAPFLSFGAELRWREISLDDRGGLELAAGLGLRLGAGRTKRAEPQKRSSPIAPVIPPPISRQPAGATPTPIPTPSRPAGMGSAALADSIVETATAVMGRPYEYGGTGEDGDGFDCSGLIQYAYAQHGITLPRRSVDQAREGWDVGHDANALLAGDILTFTNSGGPVTHVGLYIGNGQFIHSASGGVQISLLSPDDPYGKWWYERWVGARRILGS